MKRPKCKECGLKSYRAYKATEKKRIVPLKLPIFFCEIHGILDKEGHPCNLERK